MKTCTKCGRTKSVKGFYYDRQRRKHRSQCSACERERKAEHRLSLGLPARSAVGASHRINDSAECPVCRERMSTINPCRCQRTLTAAQMDADYRQRYGVNAWGEVRA